MMSKEKYKNCCCYQCEALTTGMGIPDCACDNNPTYLWGICDVECPKSNFCDLSLHPYNYPNEV